MGVRFFVTNEVACAPVSCVADPQERSFHPSNKCPSSLSETSVSAGHVQNVLLSPTRDILALIGH